MIPTSDADKVLPYPHWSDGRFARDRVVYTDGVERLASAVSHFYSDRMQQMDSAADRRAVRAACVHKNNTHRWWEAYVRTYYSDPTICLASIAAGVNVASGYPYWILGIVQPPVAGLTLHRWWTVAIARLGKDVENRTYPAPKYLGEDFWIAIHAGGVRSRADERRDRSDMVRVAVASGRMTFEEAALATSVGSAPTSAIVAISRVTSVVAPSGHPVSPWHVAEQYAWRLGETMLLKRPIAAAGRQRVWRLSAEQRSALARAEMEKVE